MRASSVAQAIGESDGGDCISNSVPDAATQYTLNSRHTIAIRSAITTARASHASGLPLPPGMTCLRRYRLLQAGVRRGGVAPDGPSQQQDFACRDLDLRLGDHDWRSQRQAVQRAAGTWAVH